MPRKQIEYGHGAFAARPNHVRARDRRDGHLDDGSLVSKMGEIDDILRRLNEYFLMKEANKLNVGRSQKLLAEPSPAWREGLRDSGAPRL